MPYWIHKIIGELWVEGKSKASALPTKGSASQLIIMDVLLIRNYYGSGF
jgi:hypothetical protein